MISYRYTTFMKSDLFSKTVSVLIFNNSCNLDNIVIEMLSID